MRGNENVDRPLSTKTGNVRNKIIAIKVKIGTRINAVKILRWIEQIFPEAQAVKTGKSKGSPKPYFQFNNPENESMVSNTAVPVERLFEGSKVRWDSGICWNRDQISGSLVMPNTIQNNDRYTQNRGDRLGITKPYQSKAVKGIKGTTKTTREKEAYIKADKTTQKLA